MAENIALFFRPNLAGIMANDLIVLSDYAAQVRRVLVGRGRRTRRDEAVWRRRRVRRPRPTLGTLTYEKEKERNA